MPSMNQRRNFLWSAVAGKLSDNEGVDCLELLISEKGYLPNEILAQASASNHIELLKKLVKRTDVNINACVELFDDLTPLILAAQDGSSLAAQFLLQHGADVHQRTPSGDTPLLAACRKGQLRTAHILLQAGANVDDCNHRGNSSLCVAAQNGHLLLAMELLRAGADVNIGSTQQGHFHPFLATPITIAIMSGELEMVALLMNRGAQVQVQQSLLFIEQMRQEGGTCIRNGDEPLKKMTQADCRRLVDLVARGRVPNYGKTYRQACQAENAREYRRALKLLSQVASELYRCEGKPPVYLKDEVVTPHIEFSNWTQLLFDIKRLQDAVYGVEASDGRVSFWKQQVFQKGNVHPPELLYTAWVQHGHKIYRHGGRRALQVRNEGLRAMFPTTDELWAFDCNEMKWEVCVTTGTSPGPRSEHAGFLYKDCFYCMGGRVQQDMGDFEYLYKLDLNTKVWTVIKTKGTATPSARDSPAVCVMGDAVYMHGGHGNGREYLNDLWQLNLKTFKWKLVAESGEKRKEHCMWHYRGNLYVYGGCRIPDTSSDHLDERTIRNYDSFDFETKEWTNLFCMGDDPWPLQEYCCIPLYGNRNGDEPHSILIYGGYCGFGTKKREDKSVYEAAYGDDDYRICYRPRLLRLDLETQCWTKLTPTTIMFPRAQSFAAEISTHDNITSKLVIGGGYGFTNTSERYEASEAVKEIREAFGYPATARQEEPSLHPSFSYDFHTVEIQSESKDFLERARAGDGWEWRAFGRKKECPSIYHDATIWSPTTYWAHDVAEEDFRDPPMASGFLDNDEKTCMGRRVTLHGLKAKPQLNGKIGRCGPFLAELGRYQVVLLDDNKRETFAVKPSNLRFAPKVEQNDYIELCKRSVAQDPLKIQGFWMRPSIQDKPTSPLDPPQVEEGRKWDFLNDGYTGPLSGKAMSILDCCGERKPNFVWLPRLPLSCVKPENAYVKKIERYEKFVDKLRAEDQQRVKAYEDKLLSKRKVGSWKKYVKLTVTLDGIIPSVERTIIVSSEVSIAELHYQILCPCFGWTSFYHAYAIRRRLRDSTEERAALRKNRDSDKREELSLQILQEECWIGPNRSTALDVFFQPLYIGGAMADDRKISLGDLVFGDVPEEGYHYDLQYVYDFGCWWTHTIRAEPCDPPEDGPVAKLISGKFACPPEDTGGVNEFSRNVAKLLNVSDFSDQGASPASRAWWQLINSELRGKTNSRGLGVDPFSFDLEYHSKALAQALRRKLEKKGTELYSFTTTSSNGVSGTTLGPGGPKPKVERQPTKATQKCAVCGVTAGLMICSACGSIAFCCREHQVQYWPQHKAECKAIQKYNK